MTYPHIANTTGAGRGHLSAVIMGLSTGQYASNLSPSYGHFFTGNTIADRVGMTAELIPHLFGATNRFPTGQRGLYVYWRTDANVVQMLSDTLKSNS